VQARRGYLVVVAGLAVRPAVWPADQGTALRRTARRAQVVAIVLQRRRRAVRGGPRTLPRNHRLAGRLAVQVLPTRAVPRRASGSWPAAQARGPRGARRRAVKRVVLVVRSEERRVGRR